MSRNGSETETSPGRRLDGSVAEVPFDALLKSCRERGGLTQRDLAGRSGVSLAAIRDLEQGRSRRPRRASVRSLVRALGLTGEDEARFLAAAFALAPLTMSMVGPKRQAEPPLRGSAIAIGVLGPLAVWRGGRAVPLSADKQRSLLLRLALSAGDVVGREELMDLLWGERRPASATNLLYTYIGRLRRLLQPEPGSAELLTSTATGYRLAVGPDQLDLAWFRDLAERGADEEDPARALGHFADAARLWRGDTDVDAMRGSPLTTAVTEEYATLLRAYATAARRLGEIEQVLPRLRELAERLELHEPLHTELVVSLSAAGRQTEALAAYERVRATLCDQLGIDPGPQLRDAHRGVLQQRWRATSPPRHG